MTSNRFALAAAVTATFLTFAPLHAQNPSSRVDSAFQKFWNANSPAEAERLVDDVVKSGVTFAEAYSRLQAGRTYTAQKTGIVMVRNKTKDGIEHFFALNV